MEALCDALSWYGFARGRQALRLTAGFMVQHDAHLQRPVLAVHTAGSGHAPHAVLGLLQAVAASTGRGLLVLPLPATATGRLLLACH